MIIIHGVHVCFTKFYNAGSLDLSDSTYYTLCTCIMMYVAQSFIMYWFDQVVAWVCLTVPLVMAVLVFLIPEAPGWLVRKVMPQNPKPHESQLKVANDS